MPSQQKPPQDFKLELNRCQGQSLSQKLSCQSRARAMPCATRTRVRARSYPPFLFVSEQNNGGVSPACPSSLLYALARRSRAPLQDAAGAQACISLAAPSPSRPCESYCHGPHSILPSLLPSLSPSTLLCMCAARWRTRTARARAHATPCAPRRQGPQPPYPRLSSARAPSPPPDARAGRREERLRRRARAAEAGKVRSPARPHSLHTHVRVHSPS